jgi:hypothetical protein
MVFYWITSIFRIPFTKFPSIPPVTASLTSYIISGSISFSFITTFPAIIFFNSPTSTSCKISYILNLYIIIIISFKLYFILLHYILYLLLYINISYTIFINYYSKIKIFITVYLIYYYIYFLIWIHFYYLFYISIFLSSINSRSFKSSTYSKSSLLKSYFILRINLWSFLFS